MPKDAAGLRDELIARLARRGIPVSGRIGAAMRSVPRHLFLPDVPVESAYRDEPIVTKRDSAGRPISSSSQPAIMAIMLDQLAPAPGHRVLEIGAGTGYNAALLDRLVGPEGTVVSVDIDADLVAGARSRLAAAGCPRVRVVCTDGAHGYPELAPYDRIIATVGVWDLAPAWWEQLAFSGRLVAPLDVRGVQLSVAFDRSERGWVSRSVQPCGFMRMRGALAEPERVWPMGRDSALTLTVPDGAEPRPADVLARLAQPGGSQDAGECPAEGLDGLWLWLAGHDPRCCTLAEQTSPAESEVDGEGPLLAFAPLLAPRYRGTAGLLDAHGIAVLEVTEGESPVLRVRGHGPSGERLAADLAGYVCGWLRAGRPAVEQVRIRAWFATDPPPDGEAVVVKQYTRLALSWPEREQQP